jgi:hypothetical protein
MPGKKPSFRQVSFKESFKGFRIAKSRGSVLLERAVKKFGSLALATKDLNEKTVHGPHARRYLRASVWHWATGQHKPGRKAAAALEKWANISIRAWDE